MGSEAKQPSERAMEKARWVLCTHDGCAERVRRSIEHRNSCECVTLRMIAVALDEFSAAADKAGCERGKREGKAEGARDERERWMEIVRESRGVVGWHLNGDVADWEEFDVVCNTLRAAPDAPAVPTTGIRCDNCGGPLETLHYVKDGGGWLLHLCHTCRPSPGPVKSCGNCGTCCTTRNYPPAAKHVCDNWKPIPKEVNDERGKAGTATR